MSRPSSTSHWRGANLIELFSTSARWAELFPIRLGHGVQESDFAVMAGLGMTYARIPLSYLWFGTGRYGQMIDEDRLRLVDRAVALGREYGIHVCLNLHRAPGYCVNSRSHFDVPERGDLFSDAAPQDLFRDYWTTFARRYADIAPEELSFDLLNEPPRIDETTFDAVLGRTAEAIWHMSPERLVVLQGWDAGMQPPPAAWTTHPRVITSVHLYKPFELTHHRAPWVAPTSAEPAWPLRMDLEPALRDGYIPLPGETSATWDAAAIERVLQPWIDIADAGGAVHVGEMGAYATAPTAVRAAWLDAVTGVLRDHAIGWALWNLRGPFGILDTDPDVSASCADEGAADPDLLAALKLAPH
ncbi:cellulase family glycosylhydrolase [Leifsonia sp. NPDC080035]|uniref:Cellulase family glycosylhydrolase n=1 Tax=Leifsonia sp. NPDC080035 TaxID=3143936 RepID=A0AAU7GH46_9MICO